MTLGPGATILAIVLGFIGIYIGLALLELASPLGESLSGIGIKILFWSSSIAVAVASFRRSRHLSGYPIWRSMLIALLAAGFEFFWLIAWCVNRKRIAEDWARWRAERSD